jgi:hypothetical protein
MNKNTTFDNITFLENLIPKIDCQLQNPDKDIINNLIDDFGIIILSNYFDNHTLNILNCEFDRIINYGEIINTEYKYNGDIRLFHSEKYSEIFPKYISNNTYFNDIASTFIKKNNNFNTIIPDKQILINKLTYNPEDKTQKNSGGDWHRDNHTCQFKLMLYLTDVSNKNGNFQFLTNSNYKNIGKPEFVIRSDKLDTRYDDDIINNVISSNSECKIVDVIGEKGTIIIVNTTNIHRGNIIAEGERKMLTQYYL